MESTTPSNLQCTIFTMYYTLYIVQCTIYFYTLYSYTSMFKSISFLYDQQLYYIIYIVHHFLQRIVEYIEAHTHLNTHFHKPAHTTYASHTHTLSTLYTITNLHIQYVRRTHNVRVIVYVVEGVYVRTTHILYV